MRWITTKKIKLYIDDEDQKNCTWNRVLFIHIRMTCHRNLIKISSFIHIFPIDGWILF